MIEAKTFQAGKVHFVAAALLASVGCVRSFGVRALEVTLMSIRRNAMDARKAEYVHHEPQTLAAVFGDIRKDLKEFFQTRLRLFMAELREKIAAWKTGAIVLGIALVFGGVAFLLLTGALVSIIAMSIGPFWALLIVGVLYLVIAGGAAWLGYRELSSQRVPPERTLAVLKEDQIWLQNQSKAA